MSKNYDIIDEKSMNVSEPVTAYAYDPNSVCQIIDDGLKYDDFPCQYSQDELCTIIQQSLEDKKMGKVYSHDVVKSMINSKIAAWK